uniref:NADH dehydrogenase subunit 6 n=1 Tax=Erianthus versicolor TaxID=470935 RepID=K9LIX9_9ORTH|nr:NADH dehydrogenase subunit 6 [Erianthus versicolor]
MNKLIFMISSTINLSVIKTNQPMMMIMWIIIQTMMVIYFTGSFWSKILNIMYYIINRASSYNNSIYLYYKNRFKWNVINKMKNKKNCNYYNNNYINKYNSLKHYIYSNKMMEKQLMYLKSNKLSKKNIKLTKQYNNIFSYNMSIFHTYSNFKNRKIKGSTYTKIKK